jgi:hypothetical protein
VFTLRVHDVERNVRKPGPEVLLIHAGVPKVSVGYAGMLKLLEKRRIRTTLLNVGNTGSLTKR